MTNREFFDSLDIANDLRTYLNFIRLPFIFVIRMPIVLLIWFFIWLGEYLDDDTHRWWRIINYIGWQRKKHV